MKVPEDHFLLSYIVVPLVAEAAVEIGFWVADINWTDD